MLPNSRSGGWRNIMRARQKSFLKELKDHANTLEEHATRFRLMSEREKARAVGAAIYSISTLFEHHRAAKTKVPQRTLSNRRHRYDCINVLEKLFTVLSLVYVPYSTNNLKTWAKRALSETKTCLESFAWRWRYLFFPDNTLWLGTNLPIIVYGGLRRFDDFCQGLRMWWCVKYIYQEVCRL